MNFYPNTTRKNLLTKTSWFQTKEKNAGRDVLLLLAHLVIGRGYRALVVWDLAAFSIPKEQMREKVARALKLKKNKKKLQHFLLSPLENDDDM